VSSDMRPLPADGTQVPSDAQITGPSTGHGGTRSDCDLYVTLTSPPTRPAQRRSPTVGRFDTVEATQVAATDEVWAGEVTHADRRG
jgi:hypothetical protein